MSKTRTIPNLRKVKQNLGLDILTWWEEFVKPNIKRLLIQRGKEVARDRRGLLNYLLIRQAYLVRKVQKGYVQKLGELKTVQSEIQNWYAKECEKIKIKSKVDEINAAENVRIYHHQIHQKKIKKSAILKLEIDKSTQIVGHAACASFLENTVAQLLQVPAVLDGKAQELLLVNGCSLMLTMPYYVKR